MHILFLPLYDFFRRRKAFFWFAFFASLALWLMAALRVEFREDITSMLPDSRSVKAMNEVVSNTRVGEQVIFQLSYTGSAADEHRDDLVAAANDFTSVYRQQFEEYIDTMILQPGSGYEEALGNIITQYLPLFLSDADYRRIDTLTQWDRIDTTLATNKKILLSPAGIYYKRLVASDPIGISGIVWNKLKTLQFDDNYETYDGYLFHKESSKLTFFMLPAYKAGATGKNSRFFSGTDDFIKNWSANHPGIRVSYFGGPVVAAGNAVQMRTDTIITLSVTIVLLLALTFYYFRRRRTPLLLLVPVIYGGVMGAGIVGLVQGNMSVIALGAGAIIMGIAIDFSIHFLSHARHATARETVKDLSQPLTLGSFTTIAAFLSLRLVDTPILRDLGLFAAASLTGAALCTLVFCLISPSATESKYRHTE